MAGLQCQPNEHWRLYANVGKGFETPTFAELGYRADGGAGLAFNLRPARSRNQELGLKWQPYRVLELDLALFRADTRDVLAVTSNNGGRSTYQNMGRSRRQGVEASLRGELADGWRLQLGTTHLQGNFRHDSGSVPDLRGAAGSRIPGLPRDYGALRLERGEALGWRGGMELDGAGSVVVDDRNRASAPGYLRVAAGAGYAVQLGGARLHLSARIDNVFDHRRIIGSVIVNDSNSRYCEPAPGRSMMLVARLEL